MVDISVLLVTFGRPKEIRKTVYELLKHQNYPLENLHFHLADNDTERRLGIKDYTSMILSDFSFLNWTYSIETRPGWGYNVNTVLKQINTNYIFLIEDDYVAHRPVDLVSGVELMEAQANIGLIRYDGIAAHNGLILHLREATTPNGKKIDYCLIDKSSQHLNVYSNRPHLRHRRFTDCYGYYIEGKALGVTEETMAHNVLDKKQCPDVAILGDGIANAFEHIGASFQGSEFDKRS
ncbi:MAG: glycosyltransferase [Candidatus Paceibacterota bacterium]